MAIASYVGNQLVKETNTFEDWLARTNTISSDMGSVVITVGTNNTGNVSITGSMSTSGVMATPELKGGTLASPGNLLISSNTTLQGTSLEANTTSYVVKSTSYVVSSDTHTFSGQTTTYNNSTTNFNSANTNFTGTNLNYTVPNVVFASDSVVFSGANVSIDANTTFSSNTMTMNNIVINDSLSLGPGATLDVGELSFTDTITFSNNAIISNSLGIGTTSPLSDLHISDGSVANIRLEETDGSSYSVLQTDNAGMLLSADTGNNRASTALRFGVDGSEHMRIDSSGNVGIGTTSPSSKLNVIGTVTANTFSGTFSGNGNAITNLNPSNISGTIPTSNLGSGTANATAYLAGDQTWKQSITQITAGAGLDGGGTSGNITLTIESDLRGDVTYIGQDTNDYIFVNTTAIQFYLDGAERARIFNNGNFHADGDIVAYSSTISDKRLKTDIQKIDNALEKITKLSGYTFTYTNDGKHSAGVIAQEVESVLPSAIKETAIPLQTGDEETVYKTVQYDQLHGLIIEAIKDLKSEIDMLKSKIGV